VLTHSRTLVMNAWHTDVAHCRGKPEACLWRRQDLFNSDCSSQAWAWATGTSFVEDHTHDHGEVTASYHAAW
jgi:hypothetical protein